MVSKMASGKKRVGGEEEEIGPDRGRGNDGHCTCRRNVVNGNSCKVILLKIGSVHCIVGVIFLMPARESGSDYCMRIFNSDGSEPEMCGNGIRCLARFAYELDGGNKSVYKIDTLGGLMIPEILGGEVL